MIYVLLLLAHLFGLMWYAVTIYPLERSLSAYGPNGEPPLGFEWWWLEPDTTYSVSVRYVCSLYWALSVMTSLKSNSAHESRQCLYHTDHTVPCVAEHQTQSTHHCDAGASLLAHLPTKRASRQTS